MINEKGERVPSPPSLSYPPHMLENPRSNAQKDAFEAVKDSPSYKEELATAEKAAEQRAAEEEAAAKAAPAKKVAAKKRAKKASGDTEE